MLWEALLQVKGPLEGILKERIVSEELGIVG